MSNYPRRGRGPRPAWRRARVAAAMTVVAAAALLMVACADSPPPAQAGGASAEGGAASWVAYSRCVRSHGVPGFPGPDSSGQLPADGAKLALRAVSDSVAKAATYACMNLHPAEHVPPALTAQQEHDYLRAAACMRSHGITNFPDPTFSGGHVETRIPATIDTGSPQVIQARLVCERLIPASLRSSGG